MHLVAVEGFLIMQVEQLHPSVEEGGFTPAAPQLNPPVGAFGIWKAGKVGAAGIEGATDSEFELLPPGAGASQAAH